MSVMRVQGRIASSLSRYSGLSVAAFHGDVTLKKERRLRSVKAGADGSYSIRINIDRYPLGVNVRVAVVGKRSEELWSSAVHYNARNDLVIDAKIPDAKLGITEFTRLSDAIEQFLQGAALAELTDAQIAYLVGRSGEDRERVAARVRAAQLHVKVPAVPEEVAYGLLRQGLPAALEALVALAQGDWEKALNEAVRANVIAPLSKRRRASVLAALNARKATEVVQPSSGRPSRAPASFVHVALENGKLEEKVATLVAKHNGVNESFWNAVGADRSLGKAEKDKLQRYAAVSQIVGNDPFLLRKLADHLKREKKQLTPEALAQIGHADFAKLIARAARSDPSNPLKKAKPAQLQAYASRAADVLVANVAARFPTDALRTGIGALKGGPLGKQRDGLKRFFDKNPDLDLRRGVYSLLHPPSGVSPFKGLPGRAGLEESARTILRLYRAVPEEKTSALGAVSGVPPSAMQTIEVLVAQKFRSFTEIAATPRAVFVAKVGPALGRGSAYAERIHDRASALADICRMKAVELVQAYTQPLSVVIPSLRSANPVVRERRPVGVFRPPGWTLPVTEPGGDADWRTLFGSLDLCECAACSSVTSPSAYLADLLNFLSIDVASATPPSPYDVLVERRPDIPHLVLNCDNANREVPYIDLLNELLGDEVLRSKQYKYTWSPYPPGPLTIPVGPSVLDNAALDGAPGSVSDRQKVVAELNQALPDYKFDMDADVSVVARDTAGGTAWHVAHRAWLVELSSDHAGGAVVEHVSRQTAGTPAELAANPQFQNPEADQVLAGATYPLSLPAALPLIETRLFLEHLGVPRHRLIATLAPSGERDWAFEYLGLSADEVAAITGAAPTSGWQTWGLSAANVTAADLVVDPAAPDFTKFITGDWLSVLGRVDVLIARAGITYVELLDLLVTEFVNPRSTQGTRAVTVESTDAKDPATCDLVNLVLVGHAQGAGGSAGALEGVLRRLPRFLRLRRRTGWTSRELDLVIRQVDGGVLTDTTLPLIARLKWACGELRLKTADLCALWGAIDTTRYIDHAADGQPLLPSQYESLFQNKEISNPVDANFALNGPRTELEDVSHDIDTGKATIAAAFAISAGDVDLLAGRLGLTKITLDALSKIYQWVLLARGFKLTIQEVAWLYDLAGGGPLGPRLAKLIPEIKALVRSKISIADAWYLLHGQDARTAHLAPTDGEISSALGRLRTELQKIAEEHQVPDPPDPQGELLAKRLGELDFGQPLVDDILGTFGGTKVFSAQLASLPSALKALLRPQPGDPPGVPLSSGAGVPQGVQDLVAYDPSTKRLRSLRPLTPSDRRRLLVAGTAPAYRKAVELLYAIGCLAYVDTAKPFRLAFTGVLPEGSRTELLSLGATPAYKAAVGSLFEQPRQLIGRKLRYGSLPLYEVELKTAVPPAFPSQMGSTTTPRETDSASGVG